MGHFYNPWLLFQNITLANLVVMVLSAFIVEGLRVTGRQTEKTVQRTRFSMGHYLRDRINVWSLVLSLACALLLQIVRNGFVTSLGLEVTDPDAFGLFYSVAVGTGAQGMVKILFKAAAGLGQRNEVV